MLAFLDNVLSDIPFLLLSTLFVILIGRVIIQGRPILSYPISYMLLGVILTFAFLIKKPRGIAHCFLGPDQIHLLRILER